MSTDKVIIVKETFNDKYRVLSDELLACLVELRSVSFDLHSYEITEESITKNKINAYTLSLHRIKLVSTRLHTLTTEPTEGDNNVEL